MIKAALFVGGALVVAYILYIFGPLMYYALEWATTEWKLILVG